MDKCDGLLFAPKSTLVAKVLDVNTPVPVEVFLIIEIELLPRFEKAISSLPSPSKSFMAIPAGLVPDV